MVAVLVPAQVMLTDDGWPPAARLGALVLIGTVVFVPLSLWFAPELRRELRALDARRHRVPSPEPA
jgi:hypothetical protein